MGVIYDYLLIMIIPTHLGYFRRLWSFVLYSVLHVDVEVSQTQGWKLAMCIVGFLVFCLSCCVKLGFQCKRVFRKEKPRRIPVHSQTQ